MDNSQESLELKRAMRDLVALSMIPAAWIGRQHEHIANGLVDLLCSALRLDLAHLSLQADVDRPSLQVTRAGGWPGFPVWLEQHAGELRKRSSPSVPLIFRTTVSTLRVISKTVGIQSDLGLVVVGSTRKDFPTELESLLLSIGSNQAATALHTAELLAERARTAKKLQADIAERKRVEHALRLSEERLKLTQRAAQIGAWELDLESEELTVSPEFCAILAIPAVAHLRYMEFLGSMFLSSDREEAQRALQRAIRSKKEFRIDFRIKGANDSVRMVSSRGKVFYNQGKPLILGVLIDVTEAAERKLKALPDSAPLEKPVFRKRVRIAASRISNSTQFSRD